MAAFLGDGRTQMAQRSLRLWICFCCRSPSASGLDELSRQLSFPPERGARSTRLESGILARARGFASYAALRELGRNGVRELVERNCECAKQIVAGLSRLKNVEVLSEPIINQGLVAFLGPDGRPSDEWNDRVIAEIDIEGTSFFSGTTWNGRRAMRISVSNWQTSREDVARTIAGVERALENLRNETVASTKSSNPIFHYRYWVRDESAPGIGPALPA